MNTPTLRSIVRTALRDLAGPETSDIDINLRADAASREIRNHLAGEVEQLVDRSGTAREWNEAIDAVLDRLDRR